MKAYLALFWNNIKRFWPLWAGVGLLYVFLGALRRYPIGRYLPSVVYFGLRKLPLPLACVLGLVCAICLWGDMLSPKRSGMLLSLPLSRWGLFLVNFFTGILFFLPVLPGAKLLFTENSDLLLLACRYMLFYGVGLLGVMLSGNWVGAVLLSGSVLTLPFACRWVYEKLYQQYLPSLAIDNTKIFHYDWSSATNYILNSTSFWVFAALGLGFSVVALVLFLLRKAEAAGKFATTSAVRYVFCGAAALIASVLLFQLLEQNAEKDFWALFIYLPVFYFAFAMVAEKRFLVFCKGNLFTLGLLAAVLFNSMWIVRYDALGILDYVPDPERVKSVEVSVQDAEFYSYGFFVEKGHIAVAPEDIQTITEVHRELMKDRDFVSNGEMIYLTYTLKSGIKVRRYYPNPVPKDTLWVNLEKALSSKESIFGLQDWDTFRDRVEYISVRRSHGNFRSYYFCDKDYDFEMKSIDVWVQSENVRSAFVRILQRSAEKGELQQLDDDPNYIITLKYRDEKNKLRTIEFNSNFIHSGVEYFVNICKETAVVLPDQIITEDIQLVENKVRFFDGTMMEIPLQ